LLQIKTFKQGSGGQAVRVMDCWIRGLGVDSRCQLSFQNVV